MDGREKPVIWWSFHINSHALGKFWQPLTYLLSTKLQALLHRSLEGEFQDVGWEGRCSSQTLMAWHQVLKIWSNPDKKLHKTLQIFTNRRSSRTLWKENTQHTTTFCTPGHWSMPKTLQYTPERVETSKSKLEEGFRQMTRKLWVASTAGCSEKSKIASNLVPKWIVLCFVSKSSNLILMTTYLSWSLATFHFWNRIYVYRHRVSF